MSDITTFKELDLGPELQKALDKQGYKVPTPIQAKSIPGLLEGRDLIGIAQTGTGKTAAFILPLLENMDELYPRKIKTLVLAPTRELAAQIGESFTEYGRFLKFKHTTIFGGVSQGKQVDALKRGVDILVATPGRLLDLISQRKLTLDEIEFFVLDEADRMLDMGFLPDIKRIISLLPPKRQSLFFSATMSPQVNTLARSLLQDPIHVEVAPQATTVEIIEQYIFFVDPDSKETLLLGLLNHEHLTSVLIFTRTKHRADKLVKFLNKKNIYSAAIHGNKSQNARTKALKDFKTGKINVLIATDIAARGIDIDNISHVINYELPNEPESYVHRIGRTARAGAEGTAFSFCCAEERNYLREIERLIKQKIDVMDHDFHSDTAQNATGAAAKPPPRGGGFNRRRGSSRGRSNGRSGGRSSDKSGGRSEGRSNHRSGGRSRESDDSSKKGGRSNASRAKANRSEGGSKRRFSSGSKSSHRSRD